MKYDTCKFSAPFAHLQSIFFFDYDGTENQKLKFAYTAVFLIISIYFS